MENNGYSVKVRFWACHITLVHIHAMFEEDMLDTLAAIAKQVLNQEGEYIKTINCLGKNRTVKILGS